MADPRGGTSTVSAPKRESLKATKRSCAGWELSTRGVADRLRVSTSDKDVHCFVGIHAKFRLSLTPPAMNLLTLGHGTAELPPRDDRPMLRIHPRRQSSAPREQFARSPSRSPVTSSAWPRTSLPMTVPSCSAARTWLPEASHCNRSPPSADSIDTGAHALVRACRALPHSAFSVMRKSTSQGQRVEHYDEWRCDRAAVPRSSRDTCRSAAVNTHIA